MLAPNRVCINGRFLTQPISGVQRYATELVRGLDGLLASGAIDGTRVTFELLVPSRPAARELDLRHITTRVIGTTGGHLWEQSALPRFADGDVLLCLGNSAPLASLVGRMRTVVTIHDLSYRYAPHTYSRSYRLFYRFVTPFIMRFATR